MANISIDFPESDSLTQRTLSLKLMAISTKLSTQCAKKA